MSFDTGDRPAVVLGCCRSHPSTAGDVPRCPVPFHLLPACAPHALRSFVAVLAAAAIVLTVLWASPAQALVPLPDYNEPNDSYETATQLQNAVTDWGAVTTQDDVDYFYVDLASASHVTVDFTTGGYPKECRLALKTAGSSSVTDLEWVKDYDDNRGFSAEGTVGPGRLFAVVYVGGGQQASTAAYNITVTYEDAGGATFPDVPAGSEYYNPITYLADEGVVSGYSSGKFGPGDLVTRQQFAKMIVRAIGYPVFTADVCPFTDVSASYPGHYVDPNDPLYPDHYIAVAAEHHITVGLTATTFGPYQNIKMAQVVTMVVRAAQDLGLWDAPPHSYAPPFDDFGEPHYPYARMGAAHGLFDGYPGLWYWFSPATRGQCAFFIWRLMLAYRGTASFDPGGGEPEPVY